MMLVIDCEQGSGHWKSLRRGIPTASDFGKIVTSAGRKSSQQDTLLGMLLAEWATGEGEGNWDGSEWSERGKHLEPKAREYYGFFRDIEPEQVGFIYKDQARMCGCSPDALVGDDGLLELKVPKLATHITWLGSGRVPSKHIPQLQGQLWVTGREWVDFCSYHPDFPPFLKRVEPDPKYQDALDVLMPKFTAHLVELRESLLEMGVVPYEDFQEENDEE